MSCRYLKTYCINFEVLDSEYVFFFLFAQAMVYGNMGDDCSTGVCFSRNPATGDNRFYGEYLVNAQVCLRDYVLALLHVM